MIKVYSIALAFLFWLHVDAADRYWVGTLGGAWGTASNWSATSGGGGGIGITTVDKAIFDANATVTMNTGLTIGGLLITNNATVTMSNGSTLTTITISAASTGFVIDAGATLNYACHGNTGSSDLNINTNSNISGTLNINGSSATITPRIDINTGVKLNIKNGGKLIQGVNTNNFTSTATRPNGLILESGSVFETYRPNGCTFLDGDYDPNSTVKLLGAYNNPIFIYSGSPSVELGNVEYNPSSQTNSANLTVPAASSFAHYSPYNFKGYFKVLNTNGNELRFCSSSNGYLAVGGDLQIATGTILSLTGGAGVGNLFVKGNIDISGTLTEGGGATKCCLYLTGTSQNMSQSGTITNDVSIHFNNSSTTLLTNITLPATINSIDSMTTGLINANNFIFTVGNNVTTAIVGGSASCYIHTGSLKRGINNAAGSYLFPLGNSTNYKPATINYTTAPTAAGTLTAKFSTTPPNFPNPSSLVEGTITNISVASIQGSWFIDNNAALIGGVYTGTFVSNGLSDIIDHSKIVLLKRPSVGGDWTLDGTHVTTTGSNTAALLSRTGMSGFSEFAIGGELGVSLPNSLLLNFYLTQNINHTSLFWNTNNDPTISNYIIQSSSNGIQYTYLADVVANTNNNNAAVHYSYIHNNTQAKMYYRLKVVDINGNYKYSKIIHSTQSALPKLSIAMVYPNPIYNTVKCSITGTTAPVIIRIKNLKGSSMQLYNVQDPSMFTLHLNNLQMGMYILEATDTKTKEKAVFKINKQ